MVRRVVLLLGFTLAVDLAAISAEASTLSWVYLDTQTTVPVQDFISTSISGTSGLVCNAFDDCLITSGSADLATGELRMFAFSTGLSIGSAGQTGFGDRIFINEPFSGTLSVTLLATLSGSYSGADGTGFLVTMNTQTQNAGWQTNQLQIFSGASVPPTFSTTFLIDSAFPYFDFATFVAAWAIDGTADFSNTAVYSLLLPTGFTFSSDSRVFLTQQQPAPIPEPASLLLLGSGIAGFGFRKWRQRIHRIRRPKPGSLSAVHGMHSRGFGVRAGLPS